MCLSTISDRNVGIQRTEWPPQKKIPATCPEIQFGESRHPQLMDCHHEIY